MPASNHHPPQSSPPQTFTSQSPPQLQYYCFRGHKKRVSELNKTKMLKTKRIKQKEQRVLRYDVEDEEFLEDQQTGFGDREDLYQSKRLEETSRVDTQRRAKSQFQILKLNPVDKLWQKQRIKRNLSSTDQHQLMIRTSRMQISSQQNRHLSKPFSKPSHQPTTISQTPTTRFYSKNLQSRMNEYLNMVVAKSSRDHQQKVKQIKEQEGDKNIRQYQEQKEKEVAKMFVKSKFLRELKTRTNMMSKKYHHQQKQYSNNDSSHYNSNPLTLRQQTIHTQGRQSSRQMTSNTNNPHNYKNFTHSRINSYSTHHNNNNHNTNNKINDGEELINFASQVLSRSMKIYGGNKSISRGTQKSIRKLNYSVHVMAEK